MTPFGKSGGSVEFEVGSGVEVALQFEMIVNRRMDGCEFLQTSHPPEPLHGPLSSSKLCGSPVEFPDDIRITNPHNFATDAGIVVAYNAPYGNTGTVVLPALAPGAGFHVSNAVPGGVTAGAPCSASQI